MNVTAVIDKDQHTRRWTALPERGTPAALRLIHSTARISVAQSPAYYYFLLPFTSCLADTRFGADLMNISTRVRSRPAHWWHVFRHLYYFAATILDRVYLLTGEFHRFEIKFHQRELLHRQMEHGQGCILLGSHLGSFEVLRALGVTRAEYPLRVLMDIVHNENLTRFLDTLNREIADTVIVPRSTGYVAQSERKPGCRILGRHIRRSPD